MDERRFREATAADAEPLVDDYHSAYRENRRLGFPAKAESVTAGELREWIREHRVYVASVDGEVVVKKRLR